MVDSCRIIIEDTQARAQKANLFYVVILWNSPLTTKIEYRRGYFDSAADALLFRSEFIKTYTEYKFKFSIYSNCCSTFDGGLFDEIDLSNNML